VGWSVEVLDSACNGAIADLGYMPPATRRWFAVTVHAPLELVGVPGEMDTLGVWLTGYLARAQTTRDSARLKLMLAPDLGIHNYPNPLQTQTTFVIGLPYPGDVTLAIYTRTGEAVAHLLEGEHFEAGVRTVSWDACNDAGEKVAPGTYEYLFDFDYSGRSERIRKRLVVTRK
jgi:hypothetical protein